MKYLLIEPIIKSKSDNTGQWAGLGLILDGRYVGYVVYYNGHACFQCPDSENILVSSDNILFDASDLADYQLNEEGD